MIGLYVVHLSANTNALGTSTDFTRGLSDFRMWSSRGTQHPDRGRIASTIISSVRVYTGIRDVPIIGVQVTKWVPLDAQLVTLSLLWGYSYLLLFQQAAERPRHNSHIMQRYIWDEWAMMPRCNAAVRVTSMSLTHGDRCEDVARCAGSPTVVTLPPSPLAYPKTGAT